MARAARMAGGCRGGCQMFQGKRCEDGQRQTLFKRAKSHRLCCRCVACLGLACPMRFGAALAALQVYKNRALPPLSSAHGVLLAYTLSCILSHRPHGTPTLGAPLPSWPRVL